MKSNGVVVFSSDKQRIVFNENRSHRFPWVSLAGLSKGSVICRKGLVPGMGGLRSITSRCFVSFRLDLTLIS